MRVGFPRFFAHFSRRISSSSLARGTVRFDPRAACAGLFGLFCVCCLVSACGASFDGQRFHKRGVDYRVGKLGPTWSLVKVEGNDLAFHHTSGGSIGVSATCGDYDDVPAEALLNHLLFGSTQRTYLVDEVVTLDGRGARHAVVTAELDGVPVRLELYVLTRSGCVFDLSYIVVPQSSEPADARDGTREQDDDFAQFVRAFHVESIRRD